MEVREELSHRAGILRRRHDLREHHEPAHSAAGHVKVLRAALAAPSLPLSQLSGEEGARCMQNALRRSRRRLHPCCWKKALASPTRDNGKQPPSSSKSHSEVTALVSKLRPAAGAAVAVATARRSERLVHPGLAARGAR